MLNLFYKMAPGQRDTTACEVLPEREPGSQPENKRSLAPEQWFSKHFSNVDPLIFEGHPFNSLKLVPVDNRIKVKDAFLNLFSSDSYHISRFVSKDFEEELIQMLSSELLLVHLWKNTQIK